MSHLGVRAFLLCLFSSICSANETYREEPKLAIPNVVILNASDESLTRLSTPALTTIQNNPAVGPQNMSVLLLEAPEAISIDGKMANVGEEVLVEAHGDAAGIVSVSLDSALSVGTYSYKLTIAQLQSTLDSTPNVSVVSGGITEGDEGETSLSVTLSLDVPAGHETSVDYVTKDITAASQAGAARALAYDEFGNPFISVVDQGSVGGKLLLDGGFPKFYNRSYSYDGEQYKYLNNILAWIKNANNPTNKVLLFGDATTFQPPYRVKDSTGSVGFGLSFTNFARDYGYDITIKDADDFGGRGNVTIPLDTLRAYSAVIVMSSDYNLNSTTLTTDGIENFKEYSQLGGGIMLIGDHEGFQYTINSIAALFGARFYGTVNRSPVSVQSLIDRYGDHPLWNGLTTIPAGGSEGNVDISAVSVVEPDYRGQGGKVVFSEGETTKNIELKIYGDKNVEADESFSLKLSNPNKLFISEEETPFYIFNDDSSGQSR
ncbi:Calx-beta domain-containing protein [Enterovibrio norvegicus]|uniref:Calx-beta domain-containing protein n=1 Tax=Enterovibrio norvegicus TaxID=188144 RepID=UPI00352FB922